MRTIIKRAIEILEQQATYHSFSATNAAETKEYLRLKLAGNENEVFNCLFLNSQHKLIKSVDLFQGTIDQCSIYPREIIKVALKLNASALIISHNHPSNLAEPSEADKRITQRIKSALEYIDVKLLDHFIVCKTSATSFAERGLL